MLAQPYLASPPPRRSERPALAVASVRGPREIGPSPWDGPATVPPADPIAIVRPGERVAIRTADRCGDRPPTGPILVEGAEAGDTLVVRIEAIEPGDERAADRRPLGAGGDLPWSPCYGAIGVAPGRGATDRCGGDVPAFVAAAGTALFLPVQRPGAHFFVGQARATSGAGGRGAPPAVFAARGTFTFGLVKHRPLAWPRAETGEVLLVVGRAASLDEADRIAHEALLGWLAADFGLGPAEAGPLLTRSCGLDDRTATAPGYFVVAAFPKSALPRRVAAERRVAAQVAAARLLG